MEWRQIVGDAVAESDNPTAGPDYAFDFDAMKEKPEAIHVHRKLKKNHDG